VAVIRRIISKPCNSYQKYDDFIASSVTQYQGFFARVNCVMSADLDAEAKKRAQKPVAGEAGTSRATGLKRRVMPD
jgi:hypothetical protein